MWRRVRTILIICLLSTTLIGVVVYYNAENSTLKTRIDSLEEEVNDLNSQLINATSADLILSLNVADKKASSQRVPFPFVEVTGSVYNAGGHTAYHAGLQILAISGTRVIMNITIPLKGGSYNYDLDTNNIDYIHIMMPEYSLSSPNLDNSKIGADTNQQTYGIIYHRNPFPNSTAYKITPVCTTIP